MNNPSLFVWSKRPLLWPLKVDAPHCSDRKHIVALLQLVKMAWKVEGRWMEVVKPSYCGGRHGVKTEKISFNVLVYLAGY